MTYNEIMALVNNRRLPMDATNDNGEFVIIEAGSNDGDRYFRLTTAQHNGWTRINYIYESGTREELYRK